MAAQPIEDGSSPGQFACFPRLPKELREMIFERALPGPRNIQFDNHRLVPTILHVCSESRAIGLLSYKPTSLVDGITRYLSYDTGSKGITRYFNPEKDTLILEWHLYVRQLADNIKFLVVVGTPDRLEDNISVYPLDLEEITLLPHEAVEFVDDNGTICTADASFAQSPATQSWKVREKFSLDKTSTDATASQIQLIETAVATHTLSFEDRVARSMQKRAAAQGVSFKIPKFKYITLAAMDLAFGEGGA